MVAITTIVAVAAGVIGLVGFAAIISALIQPVTIAAALIAAGITYNSLVSSGIIREMIPLNLTATIAEVALAFLVGITVYSVFIEVLAGAALTTAATIIVIVTIGGVPLLFALGSQLADVAVN